MCYYQLNKVKSNNSVMLYRILALSKNTMFFTFLRGFFLRYEMIALTEMCKFCVKCTVVLELNRQKISRSYARIGDRTQ